ncbi:MAG: SOS response-associated peptidase family protein [bacterium]
MDLPINRNPATIMHIDMNASFARAEQQAWPLLRGKPVGVAAYTGPGGCVVSPSYEAKQAGIKTAVNVREARMLAPDIAIIPPDPNLYREVHKRFCRIYRDYSPDVTPKSIDEAVIDFTGTPILKVRTMEENSPNRLELMKWGLVPVWASDEKIGYKMINARAETVHEKNSFKKSFEKRRCLVPITGYYEWKKVGSGKQPYYFRLREEEYFALAGLTAEWHNKEGKELQTYTIITTAPNPLAAEVHDRMPVILHRKDEAVWLDPEAPLAHLQSLLIPYEAKSMESYPVSEQVGNPRNNTAALISPVH